MEWEKLFLAEISQACFHFRRPEYLSLGLPGREQKNSNYLEEI